MSDLERLRERIERVASIAHPPGREARGAVEALLDALERGEVRAAEPEDGDWRVHEWVKRGLLLGFRLGEDRPLDAPPVFRFRDRDVLLPSPGRGVPDGIRIVPGGTVIRRGAHLCPGVVVMPPAFVNVGAWIGPGTMVDSHALVGSCAQIGANVHLSAAAQIGGVLEPIGSLPVVVEDRVFVGGGCGVYEGTRVRRGAVLAAGVILTRSVPLFDLVNGAVLRADDAGVLVVPEGAVVVPGARPATGEFARSHGVHLQSPVIVKYRDASTDAAAAIEEALR